MKQPQNSNQKSSLTRRNFIAASAAIAAPYILGAQSKSGSRKPIMSDGDFTWEVEHDWGLANLPSKIKYGNTHSVVQDRNGNIYVHHTVHPDSESPDAVVEFDDKGKFVKSWGAMFRGGAHGMHYQVEGNNEYLYFCDEKHGIVTKRTLDGEEVWTMGYPQGSPIYQKGPGSTGPGGSAGLNYRPTNFAIDPDTLDFWVGDGYGSSYMFHYNQKGSYPELVRVFGGPGAAGPAPAGGPGGPGAAKGKGKGKGKGAPQAPPPIDSMRQPHGNWIDTRTSNKVLLVADRGNRRIVRYTLEDTPIDVIEGTMAPCHFHQHEDLLVVPDLQARVSIIKGNKVVSTVGAPKEGGPENPARTTQNRADFVPGQFVNPHGACFDHDGNVFVAEWVEIGRVSKMTRV